MPLVREEMMSEDDMMVGRDMFLPATIIVGLIALAQAATPVLVWYLWLDDKVKSATSMKWCERGWMTLWIGNLAVYGLAAVFWPFSYLGGGAASAYGWVWAWAQATGGPLMLAVTTLLLVCGIYHPGAKTVWETLVVYYVSNAVLGVMGMIFGEMAKMYYMWGEWDMMTDEEKELCAKDANGDCIVCDDDDEDCKKALAMDKLYMSFGMNAF